MKTNLKRTAIFTLTVLIFAVSFSFAQDTTKSQSLNHKPNMDMKMNCNSHKDMQKNCTGQEGMKGMQMDNKKMGNNEQGNDSTKIDHSAPLEYKGEIDVKSIDDNKDGSVYQCPMDFNILSDNPGVDPKCGMKLEEVTVQQAEKNLKTEN